MNEDRSLELLQLDSGLEPKLLGQERARPPVHLEPFRLPPAPVEHQLRVEALAIGMLGAKRLELRNERELSAEHELRIDPLLDSRQAQLLEPLDFHPRERLELEVGKRAALPEMLGAPQRCRGPTRITFRECFAPDRHEPLEMLEVELARFHAKQIAGSARDQSGLIRGRRGEHLAQARDLVS